MPASTGHLKVDGGWGWVVVAGSFLNHFLFEGLVRSYGLIYLVVLDRFHGNAASTAWVQATFNAFAMATGPLTGVIVERYSCRVIVLTGGVLLCTGLTLSSFAPNLYFLYFSYSVIGGFGGGLVYSPMVVVVSQYFEKKRGKAMGIAALGGAIGTASVPPLVGCLLHHYGYGGCLIIMAAICLHHCVSGLVYRPMAPPALGSGGDESAVCSQSVLGSTEYLERYSRRLYASGRDHKLRSERLFGSVMMLERESADFKTASYCSLRMPSADATPTPPQSAKSVDVGRKDDSLEQLFGVEHKTQNGFSNGNSGNNERNANCVRPVGTRRRANCTEFGPRLGTLANPSFLLFCFNLFNIPTTLISTFIFLPGLAAEYGLSGSETTFVLSVIGLASAAGRLAFGFVFDLRPVRSRRRLVHSLLGVLLGSSTASLAMCRHFRSMVVACTCIGLSEGGVMAQRATALSQYVKPDQLAFAFGIMTMFQGFGNLLGPLLQGYLRDRLGSYKVCFCYGAAVTALSSGLLIIDYLVKSRNTSKEDKSSDEVNGAPT